MTARATNTSTEMRTETHGLTKIKAFKFFSDPWVLKAGGTDIITISNLNFVIRRVNTTSATEVEWSLNANYETGHYVFGHRHGSGPHKIPRDQLPISVNISNVGSTSTLAATVVGSIITCSSPAKKIDVFNQKLENFDFDEAGTINLIIDEVYWKPC